MAEIDDKLSAILGNPQMMQQIMSMAQTLGQSQPEPPREESPPPESSRNPSSALNIDPAMLQKILGIARQSGIDKNQLALLKALSPYLSRERIFKLEKAMRAAKIAAIASTALGNGGIPFFSGR